MLRMHLTALALIDTSSPWLWALFALGVLVMVVLDLFVFHRKAHAVSMTEAAVWSVVWAGLAAAFGAWVWSEQGSEIGLQFFAGWAIEKALAVDNIFVFVAVFGAFAVPKELRHRVLVWGVIGALVLRGIFVGLGSALVSNFAWSLPVFGALLVITACAPAAKLNRPRTTPCSASRAASSPRHPITAARCSSSKTTAAGWPPRCSWCSCASKPRT